MMQDPQEPTLQLSLQFVKLLNGDNILCQVIDGLEPNPTHLMACYPIQIVEVQGANESTFGLMPWIPFSKQKIVAINMSTIIATTNVMDSVEAMYISYVKDYLNQQNRMVSAEEIAKPGQTPDEADDFEDFDDDEDPKKPEPPKPVWVN